MSRVKCRSCGAKSNERTRRTHVPRGRRRETILSRLVPLGKNGLTRKADNWSSTRNLHQRSHHLLQNINQQIDKEDRALRSCCIPLRLAERSEVDVYARRMRTSAISRRTRRRRGDNDAAVDTSPWHRSRCHDIKSATPREHAWPRDSNAAMVRYNLNWQRRGE